MLTSWSNSCISGLIFSQRYRYLKYKASMACYNLKSSYNLREILFLDNFFMYDSRRSSFLSFFLSFACSLKFLIQSFKKSNGGSGLLATFTSLANQMFQVQLLGLNV